MTHNHNTRAKALVSGGCVISGEINFDYRTFFSKQWCIIPLYKAKKMWPEHFAILKLRNLSTVNLSFQKKTLMHSLFSHFTKTEYSTQKQQS